MSKKLTPSYRWVILTINALICALAYAGLTTWSMASPKLAASFQISPAQVSLGSSLLMLGYAVGSIVETAVAPKKGYKFAGLLGLIPMLIGIFGIPVATSYNLILLLRFFQGWGILWLVGVNSTVAWFPPKQRGMASGIIGGGLALGIGSGGLLATGLTNLAGSWQGAFRIFGVILLISTIAWAVLMKEPPKDLYPSAGGNAPVRKSGKPINPFKTAAAWLCALCLFFNCWQLVGFNTILGNYMSSIGFSEVQAGVALLATGFCGVIATPIGGVISDRLVARGISPAKARAYTMAFPGFLVAAVSSVLFPFIAPLSFGAVILMCVLCGWGVPVTNATIGALPMDLLNDEEAAGKMFGLTIFAGIGAGGILSPYAAQWVADSFGWQATYLVLAAGALAGCLISVILPKFQLKTNHEKKMED